MKKISPNLGRPAVGSSRKLHHLTTTQSSAPPAKCQCQKNPALSRKLSEGKKKRNAHGEVSEVITTPSYKETRTYMTASHPHPEKKKNLQLKHRVKFLQTRVLLRWRKHVVCARVIQRWQRRPRRWWWWCTLLLLWRTTDKKADDNVACIP